MQTVTIHKFFFLVDPSSVLKENKELPAEDSDDSGGWGGAGGPEKRNSVRIQMLPIFLVFGAFELPREV